MALFEVRKLHKRFGQQVVLEKIDLEFEENKLSGIIGPNGAGKTTFFNVLTGIYKPDRGKIIFNGEDITGCSEYVIAKKGISRSFQAITLFDDFTVYQNIEVALPSVRQKGFNMFTNISKIKDNKEKIFGILDQIGLSEYAEIDAKNLSYGQRRALGIGVALATNPKILFLDEPTQGLGSDQMTQLSELIKKLKKTLTIVIIEHDMKFLFQLADHIFVVHWGQIVTSGSPEKLMDNKWVKRSIIGKI